jgi:hypothetical protein
MVLGGGLAVTDLGEVPTGSAPEATPSSAADRAAASDIDRTHAKMRRAARRHLVAVPPAPADDRDDPEWF